MKGLFFRIAAVLWALLLVTASKGQTDVLTQHGDVARSGWNQTENQLKVSNVTPTGFGLLASRTVDGQIYAQPLVASGVAIGGGTHNVVYVATVKNTLYAFDGDDASTPAYWTVNLTHPGRRTPISDDIHSPCGSYNDFNTGGAGTGIFGIVGTPVIDKAGNTMYVVSRDVDPALIDQAANYPPTGFYQYLHAIDIRTGAERAGSPTLIAATAVGKANGNNNGILTFDPRRQNQRGGLLLMGGVIYIAYAAHCDWDNYNGWVLAYDAASLTQRAAYVASPNDGGGGIWMSGGGIAADPAANNGNGSLYVSSGNSGRTDPGAQDPNTYPNVLENRGEGIIKLNPNAQGAALNKLTIADYFTPFNYEALNQSDLDFGTQVMLVPNTNLLVAGCKDYYLYTFDKTNLGQYDRNANHNLQKIFTSNGAGMHTTFAYFGGATHKYFYQFSENTNLKAFPVTANALTTPGVDGVGNGPIGQSGSMMTTSSNGTDETTGILWISHALQCDANQNLCPGILRAVNAANPSVELWNSAGKPADGVGNFAKNACPTVANGKVYLATFSGKLNIYGLLGANIQCGDNVALNKTATDNAANTAGSALAIDGNPATSWTGSGTAQDYLQVDLGGSFDLCQTKITWTDAAGAGRDYQLQTAMNAAGPWTTIQTVTGNTDLVNDFTGKFTARYIRLQGVTPNGTYSVSELGIYGAATPGCQAPDALTAGNITQNGATISWNAVANAQSYHLRYKPNLVSSYITRDIPAGVTQPISALTCGLDYNIEVQSLCAAGESSRFATVPLSTTNCTSPCTLLTRYNHFDLGDIGVAGTSCSQRFVGPPQKTTFTIKGSGADIGGTNDEFQFAETDLAGDQTYSGRLTAQDNLGKNKAGVMMRDSLSNTSRFAFVGLTQGKGVQFIYRAAPGAAATVVQGPASVTLPCYFRIVKTGTTYTASYSVDGADDGWIAIGSVNLGFGQTEAVKQGFAVTSGDNTKLSTAILELYDTTTATTNPPTPPAPETGNVTFTAKNNKNYTVILQWTTASESGNAYFLVGRSKDGIHYDTISRVNSQGNSLTPQDYTVMDLHPVSGINYYRLTLVDSAGQVTVFPVQLVSFGGSTGPAAFPNPFSTSIKITSGEKTAQSAALYDLLGRELLRYDNTPQTTSFTINTGSLVTGVYVLKITAGDKTYEQKVVKQ